MNKTKEGRAKLRGVVASADTEVFFFFFPAAAFLGVGCDLSLLSLDQGNMEAKASFEDKEVLNYLQV